MIKNKIISAITLVAFVATMFQPLSANAASITAMTDTMSRENKSTASSQVIKFTVATTMLSSQTITVTWPSDFTFTSAVFGDVTMTYGATTGLENTCTIAASATGGSTCGAVWSTTGNRLLTLTMPPTWTTPIAATNKVIITVASTHELNPTTTGSFTVALATSAGDSGSFAVPIITTNNADVVNVTATVTPTITFDNSSTAVDFGALSSSGPRYATLGASSGGSGSLAVAHALTVGTNAPTGYTVTYNSPATLTSGSNTIAPGGTTITTAGGTLGTAQFAVGAASASGTASIASGYASASNNFKSVFGSAQTLFTNTVPTTDTVNVGYIANIPASQPAGAYSTTFTYIATGNF